MSAVVLVLAMSGYAQGRQDRFDWHYRNGLRLYDRGDYEPALRAFRSAFAVRQMPRLLLNLGQVHRKLGHAREALGFFQNYLRVELNPLPQIRAELESYIIATERLLEIAKDEQDKLSKAEPKSDLTAPPGQRAPASAVAEPAAASAQEPPAQVPTSVLTEQELLAAPAGSEFPRRHPLHKRWWFWSAVGGGVLGVMTLSLGLGLGLRNPCMTGTLCFNATF